MTDRYIDMEEIDNLNKLNGRYEALLEEVWNLINIGDYRGAMAKIEAAVYVEAAQPKRENPNAGLY